jgi:anti-sigma factor RsiW
LKRVKARMLGRCRLHPTNADLIAFKDGELPPDRHAMVGNHLQHCQRCKEEAHSLQADLSLFDHWARVDGLEPLLEAGLRELQGAMEDPSPAVPQSSPSQAELQISPMRLASIRKELTIYLGTRAVEKILARTRSTAPIPQDLISLIEPLMVGLLGNQGGSAVAGRVALLCGPAGTPGYHSVTQ